jgi:hypothetical protein
LCEEELWVIDDELHDPDWEAQVDEGLASRVPVGEVKDADFNIVVADGWHFARKSLVKKSFPHATTGSIIKVRGDFYEIGGPIFVDTDTESWWLEPIDLDQKIDVPVLSDWEYEQLEVARGRR